MSSEIQIDGMVSKLSHVLDMTSGDDIPVFDPVMMTASDRSSEPSLPTTIDPASDHLDPEIVGRRADVDEKHRRIRLFLQALGHDAVILTQADSIAWFCAGSDLAENLDSDHGAVALYINPTTRAVLTDNVQSGRIFEEELAGLGFQLKERPWHQDAARILTDLAQDKKVATDGRVQGLVHERDGLRSLRRPMTDLDRRNLRGVGRALSLAVESTCRSLQPGDTEADVAGNLAHRLFREGVTPVELRVSADDRLARHRQPRIKDSRIKERVTIQVTGRRQGVCASMARTVSFVPVAPQTRADHTVAAMVGATCFYFSRPGETVKEIYRRSKRIFEKFDHPDEWTLDYQGALVGYEPREVALLPDSTMKLPIGSAIRWGPSVGSSRSEDTIFIDVRGFEIITQIHRWPVVEVSVKGFNIPRPGILERS